MFDMHAKVTGALRANLKYIVIGLICCLILLFYIRFDQVALSSDDDVQLNLLASGALGPDSQYLIYINIVYGFFLKFLSHLAPAVNWYLVCSLFSNLCAIVSVCVLICRKMSLPSAVTVSLLCMLFFSPNFLISTQFTTNVFIYAAAGYFWLLYAIKKKKRLAVLPATLFLSLAVCWRAAAFLMTVPFFGAVLLVHVLQNRKTLPKGKITARMMLPALPFAVALMLVGLDTYAYAKDPGWSYFKERVKALVEIQDRGFVDYLNHTDLYDEAGFPMSTVNLITNWIDNDPEVYSLERLRKMGDVKRTYDPISFRADFNILAETAHQILSRFFFRQVWLPWVYVTGIIAFALRRDRKRLWMVLLSSLLVCGVYYALICYGRLGWHVEIGIWLMAFLLPFEDFFTDDRDADGLPAAGNSSSERYLQRAACALMICLTLLCGIFLVQDPQEHRLAVAPITKREESKSHLALEYVRANKENFYVVCSPLSRGYWGAETVYDLTYANSSDFENTCWLGGWFAGSPLGNYHAHEAGFTNPMRALLERPDTFLVATDDEAEWIYYYLADNYSNQIVFHRVYGGEGFGVFRFDMI